MAVAMSESRGKALGADRDTLLALGGKSRRFSHSKRDTMLYALSCGFGADPCDFDRDGGIEWHNG